MSFTFIKWVCCVVYIIFFDNITKLETRKENNDTEIELFHKINSSNTCRRTFAIMFFFKWTSSSIFFYCTLNIDRLAHLNWSRVQKQLIGLDLFQFRKFVMFAHLILIYNRDSNACAVCIHRYINFFTNLLFYVSVEK